MKCGTAGESKGVDLWLTWIRGSRVLFGEVPNDKLTELASITHSGSGYCSTQSGNTRMICWLVGVRNSQPSIANISPSFLILKSSKPRRCYLIMYRSSQSRRTNACRVFATNHGSYVWPLVGPDLPRMRMLHRSTPAYHNLLTHGQIHRSQFEAGRRLSSAKHHMSTMHGKSQPHSLR